MKVYNWTSMIYAVDALKASARRRERAAKLPEESPARATATTGRKCGLRSKIVATKEGGAITGEERVRELLGQLYGNVNNYEGRPTEYQAARTESLAHELEDVITEFKTLTREELGTINPALKKNKLEAIFVLAGPTGETRS